MELLYSFEADWPYFRTALKRLSQQRPHRLLKRRICIAVLLAVLILWIYTCVAESPGAMVLGISLWGGLAFGIGLFFLTKILTRRRIRSAPSYSARVDVVLNNEGFHASEPGAKVTIEWAAFTRVMRFADGFSIVRGGVIHWLPDAALVNAAPQEVAAFLKAKTGAKYVG